MTANVLRAKDATFDALEHQPRDTTFLKGFYRAGISTPAS